MLLLKTDVAVSFHGGIGALAFVWGERLQNVTPILKTAMDKCGRCFDEQRGRTKSEMQPSLFKAAM
eukprot:9504051-Pyramimonas_sp.AAC.2